MSQPEGAGRLIEDILGGDAAERIRAAAARGALPLPRSVLVQLWVHLLSDDIDQIREDARGSLEGLDAAAVRETLQDETCPPAVLSHFASMSVRDEALAEPIVFHRAAPGDALALLASTGSPGVVDLVLTNEERLLAQPKLLEHLMANPALRPAQRGKILEVLARVPQPDEREAAGGETGEASAADESVEEVANLLDVDVGDLLSASEIVDGDEFAQSEEPEVRSAYQKIVGMNTAQKAILAMKGNREERLILIRDTNKTVSLGVLKNPRLTESEVDHIARLRNVSEDILRQVGAKRDWTKSYSVVIGLVNNPRVPQSVSMNFVSRLANKDLRNLIANREVPELIRRAARRTYEIRTKPATGTFKKK